MFLKDLMRSMSHCNIFIAFAISVPTRKTTKMDYKQDKIHNNPLKSPDREHISDPSFLRASLTECDISVKEVCKGQKVKWQRQDLLPIQTF